MNKIYRHGGNVYEYQRNTGFRPVDFSANINPLGMPDGAAEAYADAFADCVNYPDPACSSLKEAVACYEKVPLSYLMCGCGADGLLFRICYGLKPKKALLTAPSFTEYEKALRAAGSVVDYHFLSERDGFCLTENILSDIPGHDIFIMANPDNPVGNIAESGLLEEIVSVCRLENCVFLADECFIDFTEKACSSKIFLKDFSNVIVLKAFTKMFAMPGLRLGYLMTANKDFTGLFEAAGQHWSVSYPAAVCGEAVLKDKDFPEKTRKYVAAQSAFLKRALASVGFKIYGSEANFIFFRSSLYDLDKRLEKEGFMIRECSDYKGLGPGFYRIAVKTASDNLALIEAVERCVKHG